MQREIDPGGDAGAGRNRTIHHEDAVVDHLGLGRQGPERGQQFVVRGAAAMGEEAGPRREERAGADREQAVRRVLGEERLAEPILEPLRGGGDRRSDLRELRGRLTDQHHPGRGSQALGERIEVHQPEPDRGRHASPSGRRSGAGSGAAMPAPMAMQVGEAKRLRRTRDVEQQRVGGDDEKQIDQLRACDHFRTWGGGRRIQPRGDRRNEGAGQMSESALNLSARGGDGGRSIS